MIGFTCGAFDLFHAGHNIMLRECKAKCDYLIVGLHTDPTIDRPNKNKPVQTIYERYVQLKNCKWVDDIIPYDTEKDLLNLIATVPMTVRFLGEDYLVAPVTGDNLCAQLNIDVIYLKRRHDFSTSELRNRIEKASSIL
jgi:glycerol-3-phosphate cytidylyltransferase